MAEFEPEEPEPEPEVLEEEDCPDPEDMGYEYNPVTGKWVKAGTSSSGD